ncbi:hypothetical protein ACFVS2_25875 [Brevibacillus sp. NPDC058079]|uniref:hypothetical protein n=1 Tax=Brevibacillus sp. NPDC058079 TaxID=3346330 RepID=UPI0036E440CB
MSIEFKMSELKAYPLLPQIEVGMRVLATDETNYAGLFGSITEIRYGDQKETENDTILEIVVDFEQPENLNLEETNPGLNGTGIDQIIMSEEDLGFKFLSEEFIDYNFYMMANRKIVCPNCLYPVERVIEEQYEEITWTFKNGDYEKETGVGRSDGKRCGKCKNLLQDTNEFFAY